MKWIDACCLGGSARDHDAGTPTTDDLLSEMRRLHIDQTLVRSTWSSVMAADHANEQLFDDVAPHEGLLAVPEVTPEGGEAFLDQPDKMVADLVVRGAVAGLALCQKNGFVLTTWCAGEMLDAMQHYRLPLMIFLDEVSPDHLHSLLGDFPQLPVVLQGMPRKGYHRVVYPLMAKFKQLHVVCATPHSVHLGIDYLVNRFGSDQLLWGSNFPRSEGGASITGVTYADIDDDAKEAVAGGNMQRLISEVQRG